MEEDEEKDTDLLKLKGEKVQDSKYMSVPKCCLFREIGCKQKSNRVPAEFQLAAEENLITRDHEEFRCQLPDVSRSTFLMVFSPDGKKVASTHGNHNVYVTDLTSGKNIKTLTGHPRTPWCIAFHPSSNQILASGCLGGQVRVWDLHGGSEIWTAESQTVIASLAFHPVDRMLVIASYNELHFWDWSQPEPFAKCYTANEKEKVRYVAFDQLGHKLITGVANAPSRGTTMWDRVAAPQPPPLTTQSDQERRISNYRYNTTPICYRYMVEQYEQLVQRYYDLSRARTMPTMDRGTDPMDLEVDGSRNAESPASGTAASASRSGTNSRLDVLRVSAANLRMTPNTNGLSCSTSSPVNSTFSLRARPLSFFSRSSSNVQQSDSSSSISHGTRSQSSAVENGLPIQGRSNFSRLVVGRLVHGNNSNFSNNDTVNSSPARFTAGTDERTASRSSSQYLSADLNARHSDSAADDSNYNTNVNSISLNRSEVASHQPTEANSEDSSQSSSVESVRIRRVNVFRNSEQSECSTSNSENISQQSSGRQASPRSSTSLSVSLGNLGFAGSEADSTSFDNLSESGSHQNQSRSADEPFLARPLSGLPPENIGFNIRQSGSQAGSEDSDVIIPNIGTGNAQRGSGVRVRRRRLFHESMNFSDESTLSSSQHNSPDDINDDINNLERSTAQLLSQDLNREQPSVRPNSSSRYSPSLSNRGYHRFFCDPVSDEPYPQSSSDAQRVRQRNLEDSLSSLSTSWERLSSSFQQRSNSRTTGGNSGGNSGGAGGSSLGERERGASLGERDAVSRLRRRLSAYRTHMHTQAYTQRERQRECQVLSVLSAESEAAERQLLNRLNELLERPLPERPRRFFVSRRSAFQQARSSSSSQQQQSPRQPEIGGVRCGIELLSRHIDNMQRLCRARLEILQLQQIRRMWEDLQSQIYALHGTVRDVAGSRGGSRSASGNRGSRSSGGEGNASGAAATGGAFTSGVGQRESEEHVGLSHSSRSDGDSGNESDQGQGLITDDESDGGVEQAEGRPRSPVLPFRRFHRFSLQRSPRLLKRYRPGTISYRSNDGLYRRTSQVQNPGTSRRTRTNPIQFMGRVERESESSNVSGDSSTGTSERGGLAAHPRGLKRKTRETERPRGSVPVAGPSTSTDPSSHRSFAESMRETIMQLESMVWRQRERSALRNLRMTRFTRQREERMLRNLWDTESSHESGRDDLSEGDSSQRNTAPEDDAPDGDWSRETTRRRARQILMVMVDSLTQFFEQDSLSRRQTNEALHDRIYNLYVLLQLALNLTDLLLAQLVTSRRELESRRLNLASGSAAPEGESWTSRCAGRNRQHAARHWRQPPDAWRRTARRDLPPIPHPPARDSRRSQPTTSGPSGGGSSSSGGGSRGLPHRHQAVYSNIRSAMLAHRLSVPIVRVNDLPAPDPPVNPPRPRPPSPPLPFNPFSRLLSTSSYGRNSNPFEDSSEESSPQDHRSESFLLMRAGYGPTSDLLTDTLFSMAPNHRIQAWDFSNFNIPDISNPEKNLVVNECRIHNDASVDVSSDGHLLVTLLPSGRLSMLGVYSLQWATLGQLLYRTSFEQNAVSVSLSPTTRHLVVGLASRRVAYTNPERHKHTIAQIFRLEGAKHGGSSQGRLELLRNLELNWNLGYMSLNCIRWAPNPGQGLVYGTNTGQLKLLR